MKTRMGISLAIGWLAILTLVGCASNRPRLSEVPAADTPVAKIASEAAAMGPLVTSRPAKKFLAASADLPAIAPRVIYRDAAKTHYYTQAEAMELSETHRAALHRVDLDEAFYYTTKYGTPIAYVRPIEILGHAGLHAVARKKILDYGYGSAGHLRMLAGCGAKVVGVDVDPQLRALYSDPKDQGRVGRGSVTLVHGRFPAEAEANQIIGGKYDLIISKNTLKNGYIHPAETVDKRMLVNLGVDDATFVRTLNLLLKPGGRVLIYNLCPAPAKPGEKYIPWADGRCPFPREMWESEGFRVLAFDVDDTSAARAMARALAWDQGEEPMDLDNDLFGTYTLVEKVGGSVRR